MALPTSSYHIDTVAQLSELPGAIVHQLSMVVPVLNLKLKRSEPGETVNTSMWGQQITMTYEVAQYLCVLHAMEK